MGVPVKIDRDELVAMLTDRVKYWTKDYEIIKAFEAMYERAIDDGIFDNIEFNTWTIVDNDYINYVIPISKDEVSEADWKKLEELECGYIETSIKYDGRDLIDSHLEAIVGEIALIRE